MEFQGLIDGKHKEEIQREVDQIVKDRYPVHVHWWDRDTARQRCAFFPKVAGPTQLSADYDAKKESEPINSITLATGTMDGHLEEKIGRIADKVMDIFATYFWSADDESGLLRSLDWPGRKTFKGHAEYWVRLNEPVRMVLPAFPFKSANPDKVSSVLPDFAEFLGLSRLNQMCLDIRKVYNPGAQITLATDGVVFNDLVLVGDNEVLKYGQEIRRMVEENFFDHNIKVVYAMEMLAITIQVDADEETFFATIDKCRDQIIA